MNPEPPKAPMAHRIRLIVSKHPLVLVGAALVALIATWVRIATWRADRELALDARAAETLGRGENVAKSVKAAEAAGDMTPVEWTILAVVVGVGLWQIVLASRSTRKESETPKDPENFAETIKSLAAEKAARIAEENAREAARIARSDWTELVKGLFALAFGLGVAGAFIWVAYKVFLFLYRIH